jgi:hypothetical protein
MATRFVEAPKEGVAAGLAAAEEALAIDPECAPALGVRGFVRRLSSATSRGASPISIKASASIPTTGRRG